MLTGMTEKRARLQLSRALVAIVLLTVHTNMLTNKTDITWSIECSVNTNIHHAGLGFFQALSLLTHFTMLWFYASFREN